MNTTAFMASIIRHYGSIGQYLETLEQLIGNWELELAQLAYTKHDINQMDLLIGNITEALELGRLLRDEANNAA